ncbi:MAG: hypothetical protein NZ533_11530 [Casimicrobiaceae bacterium]|nr:hypothetical protein [Casimicrobiaceae bacterium]
MTRSNASIAALLACAAIAHASGDLPDALTRQAVMDAILVRGHAQAADNLRTIAATWIGRVRDCELVAVVSSMRPGVSQSYRACQDGIEEVAGVAPAAPRDASYRRLVSDAAGRALLYGAALGDYSGYRILSRRVGLPTTADGCAHVETLVTHGEHLVDRIIERVCPRMR